MNAPRSGFLAELKRRNVFRVAVAYAVVAWLLIQAADILLANFGAPGWVFGSLTVLILLGFPIALLLSWAYELTPEGLKRDRDVTAEAATAPGPRRRLDWVVIGALIAVIGVVAFQRAWLPRPTADGVGPAAAAAPARSMSAPRDRANLDQRIVRASFSFLSVRHLYLHTRSGIWRADVAIADDPEREGLCP